ncbi:WxL protein peptidoglycan domain-containing protein [Cellulomonas soli]|uniref:WxL protein peptidoglycan domain-containing protein n=1 Tax=Cellulomonas soli TaxID=931535 RepID=UPI003F8450CC
MPRPLRSVVRVAAGLLAAFVVVLPASFAAADDTTAAWSVTPSDAAGATDGRTRLELALAPGEQAEEHVLLVNSSTVERTFRVYGADGFNTETGGFDLRPAAAAPVDVGAWVTTPEATVTVPALSTRTLALTVAVPADATPGDHMGGLVVSPEQVQVDEATGVLVDTRVAVRVAVRVAGELAPALEVRDVHASYSAAAVPFGASPATVTFEVVNTGNVKVLGVPRVRLTGPFGAVLAQVEAERTREVLPGDSFTVTTTLDDVEPTVLATAVVDVTMAAAPGPDTELPGVSSTARTRVLAVSWSGVAVVALVVAAAVLVVRRARRRRREAEVLWDQVVTEARRGLESGGGQTSEVVVTVAPAPGSRAIDGPGVGGPVRTATGPTVLLALVALGAAGALGALGLAAAPTAGAAEPPVVASTDVDDGSLRLEVPAAPTSTAGPVAPVVPGTPAAGAAGGTRRPPSTPAAPPADPGAQTDGGAGGGDQVEADGGQDQVSPDLLWRAAQGDAPARAALAASALTVAGGAGWLVRHLLVARRAGL